MPRQPRYLLPGIAQHVVIRGVDKQATFFSQDDYQLFLNALHNGAVEHQCDIHAYVLMTNHMHLLLTPQLPRSIPRLMQSLGRNYVQKINRQYRRTGTLWQGRYKACLVQSESYVLRCYIYIELNPVRAIMVASPRDYRFSSYSHNALGVSNKLLTPHAAYESLAPSKPLRTSAYRKLFSASECSKSLQDIRDSTNACLALGNNKFKDQIEAMINRRVRPAKPGRPPKRNNK